MSDKIANNPSFTRFEDKLNDFKHAFHFMPGLFSQETKQKLKQIEESLHELRSLPDRFNSLYLNRGWVCFNSMNVDLLKRCVALGENGDIENGEQALINYFKGDIRYLVFPLCNTNGFKERYNLLLKAWDDYTHNRYHACVPVFLMIIDGAINQVLKQNQGLFAQDVNLTLNDSIIGHKDGLSSLIQSMSKTRKKTTTSPIDIPYRNGILHGMDIGYDTVEIATKTLVTLFAVADWIRDFCNDKYKAPSEEKPQSEREAFEELKKTIEKAKEIELEKEKLEEWEPRNFSQIDFSTYKPIKETPEYLLFHFMDLYLKKNYGKMAETLIDYSGKPVGAMAGKIRKHLKDTQCISYQLLAINDYAPAISDISLSVTIGTKKGTKQIQINPRLIYQTDRISPNPLLRGSHGGKWYIIDGVIFDIYNQIFFN